MRVISDAPFDSLLDEQLRALASVHWTPSEVAVAAACWLAPTPEARVLDLGAGVGKFCCIGAASTGAFFGGIEKRLRFAATANEQAWALGLADRVRVTAGDFAEADWDGHDAFYLFNPLAEYALVGCRIENTVADPAALRAAAHALRRGLLSRPMGTRLATYHGGVPLFGWRRVGAAYGGTLEFWVRDSTASPRPTTSRLTLGGF